LRRSLIFVIIDSEKMRSEEKLVHPIELLIIDLGFQSRYAFAKKTGVANTTIMSMIQKQTKVVNIKLGTIIKIAESLQLTTDEIIEKLRKFEAGA